uniref:AlNc14C26G2599 protein n=1 Tax=Albugo laibachii Nc14 TaxID=890382 RepID=F0W6W3_9STRA|nr:AlNc14C26G2599 [Albugo laibachii Nc14]|eukprot:CCA16858.1 AlNc14C26G2599 [Albugo laibachii Nc14]
MEALVERLIGSLAITKEEFREHYDNVLLEEWRTLDKQLRASIGTWQRISELENIKSRYFKTDEAKQDSAATKEIPSSVAQLVDQLAHRVTRSSNDEAKEGCKKNDGKESKVPEPRPIPSNIEGMGVSVRKIGRFCRGNIQNGSSSLPRQEKADDLMQLLSEKAKQQAEIQNKVKAVLLSLADAQEGVHVVEQKPQILSECVDTLHQGPAEVSRSLNSLCEMAQRLQVPNQSARRLFLAGILDTLSQVSASSLKNGTLDKLDWNRLTYSFTTAVEIAQETRAFITEKPRLTRLHMVAKKLDNKFWPVPSSFKIALHLLETELNKNAVIHA